MSRSFNECSFLTYDAKHKVLICRKCQYAIQKSALESHLLRHKIYRGKRQGLLSSILQLEISGPDEVQPPPKTSPPVDGLPIIPGYKCVATGCAYLCASDKRMRRHWSDAHGSSICSDAFESVHLQTFFRGNKLRYFEVPSLSFATRSTSVEHGESDAYQEQGANPMDMAVTSIDPDTMSLAVVDLDLQMLRYFHHFTTSTSLTLPVVKGERSGYWQSYVVAQALEQRWLMYGLLSIAAFHLAGLTGNKQSKHLHLNKSTQYCQDFAAGYTGGRLKFDQAIIDEAKIGAQMTCILRCCRWIPSPSAVAQGLFPEFPPFELYSFVLTVQGCADSDFAVCFAFDISNTDEARFTQATAALRKDSERGLASHVPATLLGRLQDLPSRIAEAVGKPDNALDVFATLSAIDALVDCCSMSYAAEHLDEVWRSTTLWLSKTSNHFRHMIWCLRPAALIVLAHWTLLVERAEQYCWFIKGLATKLWRKISAKLPEDSAVEELIQSIGMPESSC